MEKPEERFHRYQKILQSYLDGAMYRSSNEITRDQKLKASGEAHAYTTALNVLYTHYPELRTNITLLEKDKVKR
jgi:hypothetical protein